MRQNSRLLSFSLFLAFALATPVFFAGGCGVSPDKPADEKAETASSAVTPAPAAVADSDDETGFKSIFDGKSLAGWDGNPMFWSVQEGALTGMTTEKNPTRGNTFLVWRDGELDDFELRLQYRIVGGNSGIQYRSTEEVEKHGRWVMSGLQADIDSGDTYSGIIYSEKSRGIISRRGEKVVVGADHKPTVVGTRGDTNVLQSFIKDEDWNDYTIVARGKHLIQSINGHVTAEAIDNDPAGPRSGLLALQLHAGPPMKVQFKNIRLKRLKVEGKKRVVFVSGTPSHGYGAHEHYAGNRLLADALNENVPEINAVVYKNGWPRDPTAFDNADALVFFCTGGKWHFAIPHLAEVDRLMKKGVGLACIHYGVEVPRGAPGDAFLDWIGGYFEMNWSVNPHWKAEFTAFPDHPIARGVKPFAINDEWYFHMRFRDNMEGVTPILSAVAPAKTMARKDGTHSGNPTVREEVKKGLPQHVAWAYERPDGGRGFGFTGAHAHWNWGMNDFRTLVLNAVTWIAGVDVPEGGVESRKLGRAELEANQDYPKPGEEQPRISDDPRHPSNALTGLSIAQGLDAQLFASEPMLLSPANIAVDSRGRVWVCEVVNYRHRRGSRGAGDRILILEDTNRDGKADVSKVFYQGSEVDTAHGIGVFGKKVVVSVSPNVFLFEDTDGDDIADTKELLFTKTGIPQHDHAAHSFIFGPDGMFYWNFGNVGRAVHDRNGKPIVDLEGNTVIDNGKPYFGGMVFRSNLDGSEFEVLGHNFRNNYEVTVDSFGAIWQSDNDDDGNRGTRINFVMEYGNYGYRDEMTGLGWRSPRIGMHKEIPKRHWHLRDPGVIPNLLQTGAGSPTGICFYEGDLLPEVYRNRMIHTDAGPHIVRAYLVRDDGAGYKARIKNILRGTRDRWFRPADVCVAPDGSLLVSDWYDPGVGGHHMGDIERGRIFRITPEGKASRRYRMPKLDLSTLEGAITALKSPNMDLRYQSWTMLHAMQSKAEPALTAMYGDENPRFRARALWLLGKIEGRGQHYVDLAIADSDANIRMTGLRLARHLKVDVLPVVERLVDDPSAQVRRECAIALRRESSGRAVALWVRLAMQHDGKDRWYLEALGIGAAHKWDACFDAWIAAAGEAWHFKSGRDIVWRSRSSRSAGYLRKIIEDPTIPMDELPRYLRALDFLNGGEHGALYERFAFESVFPNDLERQNLVSLAALQGIEAFPFGRASKGKQAAIERVLASLDDARTFIDLVDKFAVSSRYGDLVKLARENRDERDGVHAVRVLFDKKQGGLFDSVLRGDSESAAVEAAYVLGKARDARANDLLLPVVKDASRGIELRRQALRALASSKTGVRQIIALAREDRLDDGLVHTAAGELHTANAPEFRAEIDELFPVPPARDDKPLPSIRDMERLSGDGRRGRGVFEGAGKCVTCHSVNGKGNQVGPDLSEIGLKLGRRALFESILFPSAGISHNFETQLVGLKDGNFVTGVLGAEDADSLTLHEADGLPRQYKKSDVISVSKQDISLMPADLHKAMSAQELVDLVDYLKTLEQAE